MAEHNGLIIRQEKFIIIIIIIMHDAYHHHHHASSSLWIIIIIILHHHASSSSLCIFIMHQHYASSSLCIIMHCHYASSASSSCIITIFIQYTYQLVPIDISFEYPSYLPLRMWWSLKIPELFAIFVLFTMIGPWKHPELLIRHFPPCWY